MIFREPGHERVLAACSTAEKLTMGAPTLAETSIVLEARLADDARPVLALLVEELELAVIPFSRRHAREALEAYRRFGKGRHPASLNFGDCLTYAVAKVSAQPLAFVGRDFAKTDLEPALRED